VDVVGHSMGGLMARGFVQQTDYKNQTNYMHGYIHRLITIGTPHYGGHLAKILLVHQSDKYCVVNGLFILTEQKCDNKPLESLKDIFDLRYNSPIDGGGVEALAPGSKAYSNMCQTNISSYAIGGIWGPKANNSHKFIEWMYSNITGNPNFDLDINGFNGTDHGNNDLQVNITSQLGGLPIHFKIPNSTSPLNQSEVYNNTIHYPSLKIDRDISSELDSYDIQQDVIRLLHLSQDKFAPAIGMGSPCKVPK
jgi:triacylglycerol esterase/lipase EstA (alpha/beta hydrolase family)